MKFLTVFLLVLSSFIFGQSSTITGLITDKESGEYLSYASISVAGTNRGTVTNLDGKFSLSLLPGEYLLKFRYLGYEPDSALITVPLKNVLQIEMTKRPFILADIVVTADEDPAYRVIREAIRRKKENKAGLKNFEYETYSKKVMTSAGEVALVEETFANGFNKVGEWEREFINRTHKTENRKSSGGNMQVQIGNRYYIDFSDDTLNVLMNRVYLPLAENAFDHYDYKLIQTIEYEDYPVYTIEVIPNSDIQPLVEGQINIEGKSYALTSVDLKANKGVRFPYINNAVTTFRQSLGQIGKYWLPNYVEMYSSFEVSIGGLLGIEPISFHVINNITNYKINGPIPDSVANAVRSNWTGYAADSAKAKAKPLELSKVEIDSLRPVPLTGDEIKAFAQLDSSMTMDKMIKVTGPLSLLIPENEDDDTSSSIFGQALGYITRYGYINNNRVSGISTGLRLNKKWDNFSTNSFIAYSEYLDKVFFDLEIKYNFKNKIADEIYLSGFNKISHWQQLTSYSDLTNTISFSMGYEDQFNYYGSKGVAFGLIKNLTPAFRAGLNFKFEKQNSLIETKRRVIFNKNRTARLNPAINEGNDNSISLNLSYGKSPFEFIALQENGMVFRAEYSSPGLNSDFDYLKYSFAGRFFIPTFFNELFVNPYLQLTASAGLINGDYGIQHMFSPEVAMGDYISQAAFRGIDPYQFAGNKYAAIQIEHNWRTIIFQGLGLDFITDLHLDLITGIGGMKIWNSSGYSETLWRNKDYWEAYVSIGRIFAFLRFDYCYNSEKEHHFKLGTSILF